MIDDLNLYYGHLFEKELLEEINQVGTLKEVPKGMMMMDVGQYIKSMPLLINGAVKIMREDEDGFELLLYYLERGETCSMTLNCCLGDKKSEIRAVAEQDTKLIMIPVRKMEEWIAKYKTWRSFVFESYHTRMTELLETIDNIAFKKMDERLLEYLRSKKELTKTNEIKATHQEIALDLHTSRVVVSRLLKALEKQGNIVLHRNSIEIINVD